MQIALSACGKRALVSSDEADKKLLLWRMNVATPYCQKLLGHNHRISALCIASKSLSALTGDEGSSAHCWDVENCDTEDKKPVSSLRVSGKITSVCLSEFARHGIIGSDECVTFYRHHDSGVDGVSIGNSLINKEERLPKSKFFSVLISSQGEYAITASEPNYTNFPKLPRTLYFLETREWIAE